MAGMIGDILFPPSSPLRSAGSRWLKGRGFGFDLVMKEPWSRGNSFGALDALGRRVLAGPFEFCGGYGNTNRRIQSESLRENQCGA